MDDVEINNPTHKTYEYSHVIRERDELKKNLESKKKEIEELKKCIWDYKNQIESYRGATFYNGIILEIGEKNAKVSIENSGVITTPNPGIRGLKKGSRILLNSDKKIVEKSDFNDLEGYIVKVTGIFDGKIRYLNGNIESVCENIVEDLSIGDKVILDSTSRIALVKVDMKVDDHVHEQIKSQSWDSIGGLESVVSSIREDIELPFTKRELYEKYNIDPIKGILLYGAPGCGKTLIGKCIAYNLSKKDKKNYFIHIDGPEIFNKWFGESEEKIREIYNHADKLARADKDSPVIVFIDEAEALLGRRGVGASPEFYDKIVNQFLTMMDGVNDYNNIITILSTNREEMIDPAILRDGRIDRKINIPRPNREGTSQIFNLYLKDKPIDINLLKENDINGISRDIAETIFEDSNILYEILDRNKNILGHFRYRDIVSGAMIKGIVNRASRYAIRREIESKSSGISKEDLIMSLKNNFNENYEFQQMFVKEDWKNVFDGYGLENYEAFNKGFLSLRKYGK
ncbi:MAG: AAA family ATPase [Candidatus Pacearchaeota archaeon]|jgi:proteasome-associated ATPase